MRKLLILLLVIAFIPTAYAVDTDIDGVSLTDEQMRNIVTLVNPSPFTGFALFGSGRIVGISPTTPNASQIQDARDALNALSTDLSQEYYASAFDSREFFKEIKDNFSATNLVAFRSEMAILIEYAKIKDFAGMKTYMNQLVSEGVINAAKWTALNDLLKLQGIDLTLWP